MNNYTVTVSNIGTTYQGRNRKAALKDYKENRDLIVDNYGNWNGESVTMLCNDEITAEHIGSIETGLNSIVEEWNNCQLIKVFEFPVINKRTGEKDFIVFDIELDIETRRFIATHESLTKEESKSGKISFCSIAIDPDFCLDSNLEELSNECQTAIFDSEFFELCD
jgi:hypothetical protein